MVAVVAPLLELLVFVHSGLLLLLQVVVLSAWAAPVLLLLPVLRSCLAALGLNLPQSGLIVLLLPLAAVATLLQRLVLVQLPVVVLSVAPVSHLLPVV